MPAQTGGRNAYASQIENLLNGYFNHFPEERARLQVLCGQVLDGGTELCDRRTLPGHLTGSALVLNLERQTALLIRHKFLQRWLQPGGHLDPDEHPLAGARRELAEEAGVADFVRVHPWHEEQGVPLDIDSHVIPANENKSEPEHLHHDWLYVFIMDGDQDVKLQEDEVSHFNWVPLAEFRGGAYGKRLDRVLEKLQQLRFIEMAKGNNHG